MTWQLVYTKQAVDNLAILDKEAARRIVKKLDFYAHQPRPLEYSKKLVHPAFGEYRFRIGDYRVIFDVTRNGTISILMILSIKHRKDVYKDV